MDDETAGVPRGPEGVHESPRAHPIAGEFVTETLPEYDGGRQVTVHPAASARGGRIRR